MFKKIPFWSYLVIVGVLSAVFLYMQFNPTLHDGGDNCKYMSIARSLSEGNGFRQIWDPDMPRDYKWSPGYVIMLTGVILVTGNPKPIIGFKVLSTLSYIVALILMAFVFVKYLKVNKWITLGVVLLIALNTTLSHLASLVLTESCYLLMSMITLYVLVKFEKNQSWVTLIIAAVLSAVAVYVRIPMLLFPIAILVWLLTIKQFVKALVYTVVVFGLLSPRLTEMVTAGSGEGYMETIPSGSLMEKIPKMLQHAVATLKTQLISKLPEFIIPSKKFPETSYLGLFICLVILGIFVFGFIYAIKNRKTRLMAIIPVVIFASYMPVAPARVRHISLLSPFFYFLFVFGIEWIMQRLEFKKNVKTITWIAVFVVMIGCLIPSFRTDAQLMSKARKYFKRSNGKIDTVLLYRLNSWIYEFHNALHYCRMNLPKDAILVSSRPHIAFIVSDHQAVRDDWSFKSPNNTGIREPAALWEYLLGREATHIVLENGWAYVPNHLFPAIQKYQNCFFQVYASQRTKNIGILQINKDCLTGALAQQEIPMKSSEAPPPGTP